VLLRYTFSMIDDDAVNEVTPPLKTVAVPAH